MKHRSPVQCAVDQAAAIGAAVRIRQLAGGKPEVANVVRLVAGLAHADILQRIADLGRRLDGLILTGLPCPVLTMTGASSWEVPWSTYIFRVLTDDGSRSFRATGNRIAKALFSEATGVPRHRIGRIEVFRELSLGIAIDENDAPCACGHGCSLDLVLESGDIAVAIEHKVESGPSDWIDAENAMHGSCGGRQSEVYRRLFLRRFGPDSRFVYLSPTGRPVLGWNAWNHHRFATVVADEWKAAVTDGDLRYRSVASKYFLGSFLLDLASSVTGNLNEVLELARLWRRRGSDTDSALALAVEVRLRDDRIFAAIAEGLKNTEVREDG